MRTLSPSEYSGIGGRVHKGLSIESKPPTTAPRYTRLQRGRLH